MTRRAAQKHNDEWLNAQINVPRRKCGLFMVAYNENEFKTLIEYEAIAKANGEDVRIIGKSQLQKLEPNFELVNEAIAALYSPEEYVVDPFLLRMFSLFAYWLAYCIFL